MSQIDTVTGGLILPYPGEHSARLRDPGSFSGSPSWTDGGEGQFRRTQGGTLYGSIKVPQTVGIIWGKLPGSDEASDPPVPQALRFKVESWSEGKAREWLKENGLEDKLVKFEPAESEESEQSLIHPFTESPEMIFIQCPQGEFSRMSTERPDGKPSNLFWKEIVREGSWVHPLTGQKITIQRAHLSRWFSLYHQMTEAGLKVPVNLDHSKKAKDSAGFCLQVKLDEVETPEGTRLGLFGLLELGDQWAQKVNGHEIQDVSAGILDRPDGHGNTWKAVLDHIALTTYPVIEGQGGFVRLSAYVMEEKEEETMPNPFKKKEEEGQGSGQGQGTESSQELQEIKAQLSSIQEENQALKTQLEASNQEIEKGKEKLREAETEELQRSKEMLLSIVTEKKLLPVAGDKVKELTEELFKTELSSEQAGIIQRLLGQLVDGVQLGSLPGGKTAGSKDESTGWDDQDLEEFLKK